MRKLISILTALVMLLSIACLGGCAQEEIPGKVYFLNMSPADDETWQMLAQVYTETTGVEVTVRTVEPEEYEIQLAAELSSDRVPTLFQCRDEKDLEQWAYYTLDLTDSAVRQACDSRGFLLKDSWGKVRGIGYAYQVYGIVVNTQLLTQAGYSLEDITDFASLKTVAEDITARREELEFAAFASSGVDRTVAEQMINLPYYYSNRTGEEVSLELMRNMWDLYLENGSCQESQLAERTALHGYNDFVEGKAVFYHSDAAVYDRLVADRMDPDALTMIPLYCGADGEENAGLCCGTDNYLAVNAKASQQDLQATLKFLEWVATANISLETLARQFGGVAFKNAKAPENVFFHAAGDLYQAENYTVTWQHKQLLRTNSWGNTILPALEAYSLEHRDWSAVVAAFQSANK